MMKHSIVSIAVLLASLLVPWSGQAADDSRITSVTLINQSSNTAGASANYDLQLITSGTISSGETIALLVQGYNDDSSTDAPADSGFGFTGTTTSSQDILGTGVSTAGYDYQITLTADLPAGTYDLTLDAVINSSTAGNYVWAITTGALVEGVAITRSSVFAIADGSESTDDGLTAIVFGTNIGVTWPAVTDAAGYLVTISQSANLADPTSVDVGSDLNYIFTELTADTTYYVGISSYDSNGSPVLVPYSTIDVTTSTDIATTRYAKPSVPAGKIKTNQATVQWEADTAADYVDHFVLRVKRGTKTVATYNAISADALKKKVKQLKADKKYTIRLRAVYVTEEQTKWSKAVSFRTDD